MYIFVRKTYYKFTCSRLFKLVRYSKRDFLFIHLGPWKMLLQLKCLNLRRDVILKNALHFFPSYYFYKITDWRALCSERRYIAEKKGFFSEGRKSQ